MRIEFDPAKDAANIAKHGISLMAAALLDWDAATVRVDVRRDYGEMRLVAFAEHESRLYYVVFVERGSAKRIISLRRANQREVRTHARKDEASQAHPSDA